MRYRGKIIKWDDERGFGFVVPKGGGQPVFVHRRAFANRQRRPAAEVAISYELGSDARGRCCAVHVRHADEKPAAVELRISVVPTLVAILFFATLARLVSAGQMPVAVAATYSGASLVAFMAYARDKGAARSGQWRTPENHLHLLAVVGGWPGAILAQQVLRHKSGKRNFQQKFWFSVTINAGALVWLWSPHGAGMRSLLDGIM